MSKTKLHPAARAPHAPHPDLESLRPLVGTWKVSGDARGQIRFEWMEGDFFLMQHVDLIYAGRTIRGIEIIGRLHEAG
ncbi:MAG: hypothetical protein WBC78_27005, partial [Candidatus Sulfotelmatobacter sp.]